MPCVSDGYYPSFEDQVRKELNLVRAIACGLLKLDDSIETLSEVDWKEQGITLDQAQEWWLDHQQRDRARKRQELLAAEKQAKKDAALAKLTDEDRKILGIK